jgi:hypothetical protein
MTLTGVQGDWELMAELSDFLKIEGLSDDDKTSITNGFEGLMKEASEKFESDLSALRSTEQEKSQALGRELEMLKAKGDPGTTEIQKTRQELELKYATEDARKAQDAAVASALKGRDDMWSARLSANQAGVPEAALAECETARDIRMVTATFRALKPSEDAGRNPIPGIGTRTTTNPMEGRDALEQMTDWMSGHMGPMSSTTR